MIWKRLTFLKIRRIKMNKKTFDSIIKDNVLKRCSNAEFGYGPTGKYPNYYSKKAFDKFKTEMQEPKYHDYFVSYNEGRGKELAIRGDKPPKMASVASSSRFCYLALRDGASVLCKNGKIEFEHECKIKKIVGTAPQLDAFITNENENIYVEAKCHEIFDKHDTIKLSIQYWDSFYGKDNAFGFEAMPKPAQKSFDLSPTVFGASKDHPMFDTKQFLCHLLGISTQSERKENESLVYLFFKPKTSDEKAKAELDELFNRLQQEIRSVFKNKHISTFTKKKGIKLSAIAEHSETMEALTPQNLIVLA